jgi:hypothetical protein
MLAHLLVGLLFLKGGRAVAPAPVPVTIAPVLQNEKEATNISGAACARPGACLLVSDEKRYAREFRLKGTTITPGEKVDLLDGDGKDETDAEGAAFANGAYYVTGSHGVTKKDAVHQDSRYWVYRVKVDAASGRPKAKVEKSGRLLAILQATPELKAHAEQPLQDNGVNIEGLAVRGHDLWFGFRGPTSAAGAYVMKVSEAAVFEGAAAKPAMSVLPLGTGQGVRDLAALAGGGFLVLSGPQAEDDGSATPTRAQVFFWDGVSKSVRPLADAPHGPGAKPESLTVLADDAQGYEVLIMCDGPSGGAPVRMRVPR